MMEEHRKVPTDIIKPAYIKVDSASCYPVNESDNIIFYAGQKNNDKNILKIKKISTQFSEQIELVLIGDYHKEIKSYAKTNNWSSWFRMDIPLSEIDKLINQLNMIKADKCGTD